MYCSDAKYDCNWVYMQKLGVEKCWEDCWYWREQRKITAMKAIAGITKED